MGRFNKRLAAAKKIKADKSLSVSAVAKTLAKQDKSAKEEESLVQMTNPVKLLLEKPTSKVIKSKMSVNKITKKDKQKIRKEHLQQKLQVMTSLKKEEKEAVKRKKKAIVGDLKPITETLDKILSEDSAKKNHKNVKPKSRGTLKLAKAKAQMDKDLSIFQQVLKHPQYSSDPFNTITTHIENKMLMEAMTD